MKFDPYYGKYFDSNIALAAMLLGDPPKSDDDCWEGEEGPLLLYQGKSQHNGSPTVAVSVICSDVFAWACADCEELPANKIQELYDMWAKDPINGPLKWCCKQRNTRPQAPLRRALKEEGVWEDWMDELNPNHDERKYE